jgi:hypothetical protein
MKCRFNTSLEVSYVPKGVEKWLLEQDRFHTVQIQVTNIHLQHLDIDN